MSKICVDFPPTHGILSRWFECSSQLIDEKKFILFVLRDVSKVHGVFSLTATAFTFRVKGKHVVGTFLRESSTSTAHCVIIMSVIGQKMLIQETQGTCEKFH